MVNRAKEGTVMRTDEGKTSADLGVKKSFSSHRKVAAKKDDMAERLKGKGMPYTMSTQSGAFEEGRGQRAKMWGSSPTFSRGGGMPYEMNGPSKKTSGERRRGETPRMAMKSENERRS